MIKKKKKNLKQIRYILAKLTTSNKYMQIIRIPYTHCTDSLWL